MKKLVVCGLFSLLLVMSCSMFSTRPSHSPSGTSNSDPLNFGQLTAKTQYQFTHLQYEDLFQGQDPIYFDNNSGPSTTSQLIQRLRQIDTTVKVTWSGISLVSSSSPDTVFITEARYAIEYLHPDSTSGGIEDTVKGKSKFTLANNAGWHICYWKDTPDTTVASFFSPNFSH